MVAMPQDDNEVQAYLFSRMRDLWVEAREQVGGNRLDIVKYIRPLVRQDIGLLDYTSDLGILSLADKLAASVRQTAGRSSLLNTAPPTPITKPAERAPDSDLSIPTEAPRRPTGLSRGSMISTHQAITGNREWQDPNYARWALTAGVYLPNATAADLDAAIKDGQEQVNGRSKNTKFYQILRSRITNTEQRVIDVWPEADVHVAMKQAAIAADETLKYFNTYSRRE